MRCRDVALGDRDEAGKTRLGGEEVVAVGVGLAVGDPVADGEEVTRGIEEETEVHLAEQAVRKAAERGQPAGEGGARTGRARQLLGHRCAIDVVTECGAHAFVRVRGVG